ncbi:MAG TPA: hypothetical protein PKD91_03030, partial [Bacteroidia bacterium]|nr:hypothetical protein [Bacteroidia bacterium]
LENFQTADDRIGKLTNGEIITDIAILGSSRALNNYSPEVISKVTGLKCYNFGVSGSDILFHETVLDLILSQPHKPKIIIYNLDDRGIFFTFDGIVYRKDVLYPFVDNAIVNKNVCQQLHKWTFATYLSKTYRQNVNFINSMKYLVYGKELPDYKTTNFNSFGANLLEQRAGDPIPAFLHPNYDLSVLIPDSAYLQSFQRIQEKCKLNNIKLILSLPPLYADNTPGFKELILSKKFNEVEFWDFTSYMQDSSNFFNPDHMNRKGAEIFSGMVANKIKTH